jgi:hypothetical protein
MRRDEGRVIKIFKFVLATECSGLKYGGDASTIRKGDERTLSVWEMKFDRRCVRYTLLGNKRIYNVLEEPKINRI